MTETTQRERDLLRLGTIINGALHRALNDADRCARIERCCLLRSEIEAPEWARWWRKSRSEMNGVPITPKCIYEGFGGEYSRAPDFRPDTNGPLTLPILEC